MGLKTLQKCWWTEPWSHHPGCEAESRTSISVAWVQARGWSGDVTQRGMSVQRECHLLRLWDLFGMNSIWGSHMARSFPEHVGLLCAQRWTQKHRCNVPWEQLLPPDKHPAVQGQGFWLEETGGFQRTAALCSHLAPCRTRAHSSPLSVLSWRVLLWGSSSSCSHWEEVQRSRRALGCAGLWKGST